MKGKVKIGNQSVEMVANAATPVLFKEVFHEDYFQAAEEFSRSPSNGEVVDIYSKIGFIAAHQAKKDFEVQSLTFEDYLRWLEQFEAYDMLDAVDAIAGLYSYQAKETAVPKK